MTDEQKRIAALEAQVATLLLHIERLQRRTDLLIGRNFEDGIFTDILDTDIDKLFRRLRIIENYLFPWED
jgi:hypothetical protein